MLLYKEIRQPIDLRIAVRRFLMGLNTMAILLIVVVLIISSCAKQDPPDPEVVAGEAVFKQTCKVCHASGINGAPIVGNNKMWQPRLDQGVESLVEHATEGYGLMPAKGGNADLSKEQIRQAVSYFLARLESE